MPTFAAPSDQAKDPDANAIVDSELSDFDETPSTLFVSAEVGCDIADPAIDHYPDQRTVGDFSVLPEIHAGLFELSVDGTSAIPALISSYTVSDDGLTYEFVLKDNSLFSDGTPLVADDVKWSWERAWRKSTGASRASDVFGLVERTDGTTVSSGEFTGIEIIDDQTLKVHLTSRQPDFEMLLADPVASILKSENVEKWPIIWTNTDEFALSAIPFDLDSLPVGAGPFKLVEYASHEIITSCSLVANEYYWRDKPSLHGILVKTDLFPVGSNVTLDQNVMEIAFEEKIIDYYISDVATIQRSITNDSPSKAILAQDVPKTWFVILNPSVPPFDDIEFRRALLAGSDVALAFGYDITEPRRLVPESIAPSNLSINGVHFDAEIAMDAYSKSRYSESDDPIQLHIRPSGLSRAVLPPLFDQWRDRFGIDVIFDEDDTSGIAEAIPLKLIYLAPQYAQPHAVLRTFITPFGTDNPSSDLLLIENILKDAMTTVDTVKRNQKYIEIEQLILDRALAIPLKVDEYAYEFRVQSWVNGLTFSQYGGSQYRDVWFDDDAPDRPSLK